MAKIQLRNFSTSLAIRTIQIKTTVRYYATLVKIAKIKNTDDYLCWRECGVREITPPLLVGVETCTATLEIRTYQNVL